jgi:hypothetical protein
MTDPTTDPCFIPRRPWDVRELAAGDVLRRSHRAERVVRRVPTEAEAVTAAWRSSDRWSQAVIRELDRLGHDSFSFGQPGQIYVTGVGRTGFTLAIRFDVEGLKVDDFTVLRVTFGREVWTARQAALWLRKRAAK